jgi:SAM-dependent methyltransferase
VGTETSFDQLLDEGNAEPIDGWDFSWLRGRATEARPSWKYFEGLSERMDRASAVLDVQTGGGERFADVLHHVASRPITLAATESWRPNVDIARSWLTPLGVTVDEIADTAAFPFEDETFDLVCSRHPTVTQWSEIARVLQSEGIYYSQQIGAGTNSELTNFMMDPQPISETRRLDRAVSLAASVGLEVINAQEESLAVAFFDVGAVVYFLRKVIWTVPDFSTGKYRERLKLMHDHIEANGSFVSHSQRFLIEARKKTQS